MMVEVGCLVYTAAFLEGFLLDSVLEVDIAGSVKKKRAISGFLFKVMLGGYFCVSGLCIFQIYCGTMSNIS